MEVERLKPPLNDEWKKAEVVSTEKSGLFCFCGDCEFIESDQKNVLDGTAHEATSDITPWRCHTPCHRFRNDQSNSQTAASIMEAAALFIRRCVPAVYGAVFAGLGNVRWIAMVARISSLH